MSTQATTTAPGGSGPISERHCLDIIRAAIEGLSDEQIHLIIENIVGGFVGGMIDDIHARKDDIVAEVVGNVVGHIAAAAQHAQLRDVAVAAAKIGAPSANIGPALIDLQVARPVQRRTASSTAQDAVQHVCEACGREGTRRYVQTATGWRCAPSSAKKCAREAASAPVVDPRFTQRAGHNLSSTSDTAAQRIQPKVTPKAPAASVGAVRGEGDDGIATARCQDCNRAWTLNGIVLTRAVEVHELQKGHIVDVFDSVEGGAA